jgi:NAD(P)-dependent dehydrogenase (short-subunit alcohol dehydrogenase family)
MKKILILGGNSDIGTKIIDKLENNKNFMLNVHYNNVFPKKKYSKKIKRIKKNFLYVNNENVKKIFDNNYDIIINLVGYVSSQSFLNFSLREIQKTILINSFVPFLIIRNSLNNMIKKRYGRIINTSSIGVKFGGGNRTFSYSLSKHINEFIPGEIRKLYSKNIFYNTLRIGVTNTKFHKKIKSKSIKERTKLIPVKKMATTNDVADYILYLIINNNFITNEIINITGGE